MTFTLQMDAWDMFKVPGAKYEFLSWAMSDSDFLESFIDLLLEGASPDGSWPGRLNEVRVAFHKAMGDDYLASAHQEVIDADQRANNARAEMNRTQYRLDTIHKHWKTVVTLPECKLNHDDSNNKWTCPACAFIRAVEGRDE